MKPYIAHLAVVAWANGGTLQSAGLRSANLWGADLRSADLRSADLWGADLWNADLWGANLWGADLRGAKCYADTLDAYVTSADRGDYGFRLFRLADGSHKVLAGCRWLTIDAYVAHVEEEYPDTPKARRTHAILDYFDTVINENV